MKTEHIIIITNKNKNYHSDLKEITGKLIISEGVTFKALNLERANIIEIYEGASLEAPNLEKGEGDCIYHKPSNLKTIEEIEQLAETLSHKFTGYGHHEVFLEIDGKEISKTIDDMELIDVAFDDCYDDCPEDNEDSFYPTRFDAQKKLVELVLRANEIDY